jgi:hypothetical protein
LGPAGHQEGLTRLPLLDLAYAKETEAALPAIAGGVSVALARSFKILSAGLKNPMTEDWERAFRLFDLLI